jgi:dihydroorotate dehydrogenase
MANLVWMMMTMFEQIGLHALRLLDPEKAHGIALKTLKLGMAGSYDASDHSCLATNVFDRNFKNPIGIAAGFDKHCEALPETLALGPGFTEIGGVAPKPQAGNPKPRLFRLTEDQAVINRFGFNSLGHEVVASRLEADRKAGVRGIVGVNLAINKTTEDPAEDYAEGIRVFGAFADFLTINISSPNTAGLRDLQGEAALASLLDHSTKAHAALDVPKKPALLVKVAPDLDDSEISAISDLAVSFQANGLAGLVVSNTTIARPSYLKSPLSAETGGLSGAPLFETSTSVLRSFARRLDGRLPIIGVGGVTSGEHAYLKIKAGASLVQLYSALVYQGPSLISRIKQELADLLQRDGIVHVSDAIGRDL